MCFQVKRRTINEIEIQDWVTDEQESKNNLCCLYLRGDGFLWHQVRCIMGALYLIGEGKEELELIDSLLDVESHKGHITLPLAEPKPLVLVNCEFPELEFDPKGFEVEIKDTYRVLMVCS